MGEIIPFRPKDLKQAIMDRICGELQDGVNVFGYLAEVRERSEAKFRVNNAEYFQNMPIETREKCRYIVKEALKYTGICLEIVVNNENYSTDKDFTDASCALYRIVRDFGELHRLNYINAVSAVDEYIPEEGDAFLLLSEIQDLMGNILVAISKKIITNEWLNYYNQLVLHMSALLHTIDDASESKKEQD